MGKNQHSKDKMYITKTEWKHEWGGFKDKRKGAQFGALEFDRCALSFLPFQTPVATPDGTVFDILNIVPWIKKHKTNPATGKPLALKHLIRLNFKKNTDGKYCCPVTFKVFTKHSRIAFIKVTGNVFLLDTIEELNYKAKCWKDLVSEENFIREDVVTIQDPNDLKKREVKKFHHVANDIDREPEVEASTNLSEDAKKSLEEAGVKVKTAEDRKKERKLKLFQKAKENGSKGPRSLDTDNRYAASFTSTAVTPYTSAQHRLMTEDEILEARYTQLRRKAKDLKKKGAKGEKAYVRLETNMGSINLELHCELAPKTCHNFLLLCQKGYYKDVIFHRLIKDFMIQGGDPTGTGHGGQSAWGGKFQDEFHPWLKHDVRGVLSMANAGSGTNGSQFFITFKECKHLDNKHSVFGRVVGGMNILDKMENVECGVKRGGKFDRERPQQEIKITGVNIFQNPFDKEFVPDEEQKKEKKVEPDQEVGGRWFSAPQPTNLKTIGIGIDKYLEAVKKDEAQEAAEKKRKQKELEKADKKKRKKAKKERKRAREEGDDIPSMVSATSALPVKRRIKPGSQLSDFSSW